MWGINDKLKKDMFVIGIYFLVGFLLLKYGLPLIYPLLFAFLLVGCMYPLLKKTKEKMKLPHCIQLIFLFLFFLFIVLTIFCGIAYYIIRNLEWFKEHILIASSQVDVLILEFSCFLEETLSLTEGSVIVFITNQKDFMINSFISEVFPNLTIGAVGAVKWVLPFLGKVGIFLIAVFLLLKDYEKLEKKCGMIFKKTMSYGFTYLKMQILIITIISMSCIGVFLVLKLNGAILLGVITGLLDALPLIGTSIILIPIAILQIVVGDYLKAVFVLVLYGFCIFIREYIEPKYMGKSFGVLPIFMLSAIYIGIQLFGISGIIKGPILFLVLFKVWNIRRIS
ncbi:MAG: AI-2E family transporter [Lachnospiraceae bacterium]